MSEQKRVVMDGFVFGNDAEAQQAAKELQGIRYIREKTDMGQPEQVLETYNKIVRENLFETAVGISYLKEMQKYLVRLPAVKNEEILPIIVRHPVLETDMRRKMRAAGNEAASKKAAARESVYRKKYRIALFIAAVLAVSVIGMFVISATNQSPTVLNYENALIDRYAQWEQELTEREAALNERERALGLE